MQLTQDEIIRKIKTRLGYGARCIALMQNDYSGGVDHYAEAISRALALFNQYMNRHVREYRFVGGGGGSNVDGSSSYVDYSNDPNLIGIYDVVFMIKKDYNLTDMDPFTLMGRTLVSTPYTSGTMSTNRLGLGVPQATLSELLAARKSVLRQRGLEPDWYYDKEAKILVLWHPTGPYEVNIIKVYEHTLETLPQTLQSRFLDAVEAYCRYTLADILGMFGGEIPGPTGPVVMDVEAQRQRADTIITKIEEYLKSYPLNTQILLG